MSNLRFGEMYTLSVKTTTDWNPAVLIQIYMLPALFSTDRERQRGHLSYVYRRHTAFVGGALYVELSFAAQDPSKAKSLPQHLPGVRH